MKHKLLALTLAVLGLFLFPDSARAQGITAQFKDNSGATLGTFPSGTVIWKCGASLSCTVNTRTFTFDVSSAGGASLITVNSAGLSSGTANFNDTTPNPSTFGVNVHFQKDTSTPTNLSAYTPFCATGGSHTGGAVPDPGGSGTGSKYLGDDCGFHTLTFPTLYYQTVQSNGSSATQQPRLNFSTDFTVTNNSGNTSTDVALANAGSYALIHGTPTPGDCAEWFDATHVQGTGSPCGSGGGGGGSLTGVRKLVTTATYNQISSDVGKVLDIRANTATTVNLAATVALAVDQNGSCQQTSGSSVTPATGTLTLNANTVVFFTASWGNAVTITSVVDNLGNTYTLVPGSGVTANDATYYAPVTFPGSATISINFSGGANFPTFCPVSFVGVNPSMIQDGSTITANVTSPAAQTIGPITTTFANDLIWCSFVSGGGNGTINSPFTNISNGFPSFFVQAFDAPNATGSPTCSTTASSVAFRGVLFAFKGLTPAAFIGWIKNNNTSGNVTVTPPGGTNIDGNSTLVLTPGSGAFIGYDGTEYVSVP